MEQRVEHVKTWSSVLSMSRHGWIHTELNLSAYIHISLIQTKTKRSKITIKANRVSMTFERKEVPTGGRQTDSR